MSSTLVSAFLILQRDMENDEKIKRRILRDHSNPMGLPQEIINKEAFSSILEEITPLMKKSSVPQQLKLAATLRFLAVGCFRRSVGKDADIALERSMVCKTLTQMLNLLERVLCPKWIRLQMSEYECQKSKAYFFDKYGIPGVVGCIDGTHVKLVKPNKNDHLFFNRKGCFSVNVMIICDYNMCIRAVDGRHPGSSHDSFVFNMSNTRDFYLSNYESGERGCWLLGDSGYALEPFLLTPYRNPSARSEQHLFNLQHAKARNIVERVIGVLKSRFRCFQKTLHYRPQKVVKIVNICTDLHNVCRYYKIADVEEDSSVVIGEVSDNDDGDNDKHSDGQSTGQHIRDAIAQSLIQTNSN